MDDPEAGPLPSGLIQTQAASYADSFIKSRSIDEARWKKAEQLTEELIKRIRGTPSSEARRRDVADYVASLIRKCFDCQVYTFGSVPLKTYLPDGDIDLTIVSRDPRLKDTWANAVRSALEKAERNKPDEKFRINEVQYINAEVKLIKCHVENIVVDISFNQFGGLCTLCFLEEVDRVIANDHVFKRSIILVKAWCYYESAILGAHHGLISTYALETLVLYIFHVFHSSLRGPLEVLLRFLEFFGNFDWHKYAVSVWGPVSLLSMPGMIAEPPRKDGGDLLLSKDFLDACVEDYAVFLTGPDSSQGRAFTAKHLNIVDPLRAGNNLGRSVNQTNFNRITKVLSHSAEKLLKMLLDSSKDVDEHFEDKKAGIFRRTKDRLDQFEEKRPDAAANGTAQSAIPGYGVVYFHNYQNGWGTGQGGDGDTGHTTVPEINNVDKNLKNSQEGWTSELEQRKPSSAPTQMGGSHSNTFHPPANRGTDCSQFPSDNGISGIANSNSSSEPEASHAPGYTGGKGIFSKGEAKPSGFMAKTGVDSGSGISIDKHIKTSRQQGDARSSVASSTQSSDGRDLAPSEYRSSYTQTNFDSNGALVSSSGSPSSESSRGSVNFSNEIGSEGVAHVRKSSSNHSLETEVSRRSGWVGEQPSHVATSGLVDAQGHLGQDSVSRGTVPLPVSVIPHAQIPISLPLQGQVPMQIPMHLATSMAVSQPMTHTGPSPQFGLHPGNVSTSSFIIEAPLGLGSRVGPYYAMQLPRGPPVPPLPPGYFHVPPLPHHLSTAGEIPNAAGRISAPFPVQHGDDQSFEQQQVWQQQMEQMQQHGIGYLRPVPTIINAAAMSPLPQLLNPESSTVISSASVGFAPYQVPVSIPATRSQSVPSSSGINLESTSSRAIGHDETEDGQSEELAKSLPGHGDVGNLNAVGGKLSLEVGSEVSCRPIKSSKSGKEKRTSSKSKSMSNEDVSDVETSDLRTVTSGVDRSGQASADDTFQMRQGHPQQQSSAGSGAGPSVYPHLASSSLPLGTGLMKTELSPYPPPMIPIPKTTAGYAPLHSQVSIQTSSLPGLIPVAELGNGVNSLATKQRPRSTESAPLPPSVYFPAGNPYPLLSMQRVYVVPPSPDQAYIGLDAYNSMQYSKPFDSHSDLSASQADDSRMRFLLHGRPGVGERLRAAGVATSCSLGSEAIATDGQASDGGDSNFFGGDLLSSDFSNHLRNLDYARWCQNKQPPGPIYPQPYMAPSPKYYPEYRSWEGPGRPLAPNANVYSNVMSYGHGVVQGPPSISTSVRMAGSFPRSFVGPGSYGGEDLPKSHGGTGTYLPTPRPHYIRDRQSSGNGRNQHSGYSHERGERLDRETNQVNGPRLRGSGRGQSKYEPRPQSNNTSVERYNADVKSGEKGRDRDIHRQYDGQRRNPTQAGHGTAFTTPSVGVAPVSMTAHSSAGSPIEMYSVPNMTGNGKASTSGTVSSMLPVIVANPVAFGSVGQVPVGSSQAGSELDNGAGHISNVRTHEQLNAHTFPGLAGLPLASGDGSSQGPSSPKQRPLPHMESLMHIYSWFSPSPFYVSRNKV